MEINKLIPCDFSRTQQAKCTLAIVSDVQLRITVAASAVAARQSQQQQQQQRASASILPAACTVQAADGACIMSINFRRQPARHNASSLREQRILQAPDRRFNVVVRDAVASLVRDRFIWRLAVAHPRRL